MRISRFAFLVAVLATFLPQSAEAQYVWTGQGTGWQGQVTPPYGGSAALVFGNSIYPLVSLTPFTSVGSISLEGGNDISFSGTTNLAISGTALGSLDNQQGDFYFGSGINLALSTSTTFNVGENEFYIAGQVTGTGPLTLSSSYGGGTIIFNGTSGNM